MAKTKTAFHCQNCGASYSKWLGKCTSCNEWNSITEETVYLPSKNNPVSSFKGKNSSKSIYINHIDVNKSGYQIVTGNTEFDRVMGGGIVLGSVVLLSGEPGVGKSTLVLEIALKSDMKTLYVSGEESEQQIKMRANRIASETSDCMVLTETNIQNIFSEIESVAPLLIVIDSIQTLYSDVIEASVGSISQIRQCATELIHYSKQTHIPIIIIGHINKEGYIAGPKVLEHMVDVVLSFEGDKNHLYRTLRAFKNRYGSTAELGIYEMANQGLKPIDNPSELFFSDYNGSLSGTSIAVNVEGMRSFLIEVQALVSNAVYGTPQRSTTGFNAKRLNMLLAVLEKRAGFKLASKDVFLNITGGIVVNDTAIDLAVIMAIISSNGDIPIDRNICFAAEVGLTGEIRPVIKVDQRVNEADKLGFDKIIISKHNKFKNKSVSIEVVKVSSISDLISYFS